MVVTVLNVLHYGKDYWICVNIRHYFFTKANWIMYMWMELDVRIISDFVTATIVKMVVFVNVYNTHDRSLYLKVLRL